MELRKFLRQKGVTLIIILCWTSSEMGAYGFGLNFRVRECVRTNIPDMYGPILFVLDTNTTHDGVHMHVIFYRHQIQDGRLAAILVVKKQNLMSNTSCIYQYC